MNIIEIKDFLQQSKGSVVNFFSEYIAPIIAKLIPGFIRNIEQNAYRHGRKAGISHGLEEGYKEGVEHGKNVWLIEDQRTLGEPPPIDQSVYGPLSFTVTASMQAEMRKKVEEAVRKNVIDAPTDDQWKMIFATSPATCVIAGAGSGKSTTLILRVIFMLFHCRIPLHQITVVSFTTAACEELRVSLIRVMQHWCETPLTKQQAKNLVRTFHSALHRVTKSVFGDINFFENVGAKKNAIHKEKIENHAFDEESDEEVENPFSTSKLNNDQLDLLKNAYIELFNADATFKEHVQAMVEISLFQSVNEKNENANYSSYVIGLAAARDLDLVKKVNSALLQKGDLPLSGFTLGPVEAFSIFGKKFYANGIITSTNMPVFFGGFTDMQSLFTKQDKLSSLNEKNEISIFAALKVKKNILSSYCGIQYFYVNSGRDLDKLKLWIRVKRSQNLTAQEAVLFDIQLEGEKSPASLFEAFYSQAGFIQSMGLDVSDTIRNMAPFRSKSLEYHFCYALPRYWAYFEESLKDKGIITFNYAFLLLAGKGGERAKRPSKDTLSPFTHLLIDEFQDISPQIVAWLLSTQRQKLEKETSNSMVSIMAIGDDWQSIYGWRGSAPTFFIDFDRHFPSHQSFKGALKIPMIENFRSIGSIVQGSEILLRPISNKSEKICIAKRSTEPGDHGIELRDYDELDDQTFSRIADLINEQYMFANGLKNPHKNRVIVMARRRETLRSLKDIVGKKSGVIYHTYHGAKGLQGEVAVMVEDCVYDQEHIFRNRVYKCVSVFPKGYDYDQSQKDEAARLAYVGTTRGRRRVIWFAPENATGAAKQYRTATQFSH